MILSGFNYPGARRLASLAVVALIVVAGFHSALAKDDSPVAATVNGETISRTEILLALELLSAQFRSLPPEQLFPLIRNQLIDIRLLSTKGAEAGLREDLRVISRVDFYAMRLSHNYYVREIVGNYLDEELLQEGYQKFVENFPKSEEFNVSHILVATEDEAKKVAAELKSDAEFSATARRFFVGPSEPQGGALDFLRREQVVPEFTEIAFALEDGDISEPVKPSSVGLSLRPWTGEFPSHLPSVRSNKSCAPKLPTAWYPMTPSRSGKMPRLSCSRWTKIFLTARSSRLEAYVLST